MKRLTPEKVEELWLLNSLGQHAEVIESIKSEDWLSLINSCLSSNTERKRYTGISYGMLILNSSLAVGDFDLLVQFCLVFDYEDRLAPSKELQSHFRTVLTAYLSNRSYEDVEIGGDAFDISTIKQLLKEQATS